MHVVALLAFRNEELYLERCIKHLVSQGVDICLIDNESEDGSMAIGKKFLGAGVSSVYTYPFKGFYDWEGILKFKQTLAAEMEADWFIHHDADEIRYSDRGNLESLAAAISDEDAKGYNAINFDEFVFVPTLESGNCEGLDFVENMQSYYFFEPRPLHRVNAWKKQPGLVDLTSSGGHQVNFPGISVSPRNFSLCHYIFLSAEHFETKYRNRVYSQSEIEKGWHWNRIHLKNLKYKFPDPEILNRVQDDGKIIRSKPLKVHFFYE